MTTGATGQLGLALPVQGELSGTWGDTVNNGITQYTNIAIAGTLTLTGDGAVTLANTTGDASASNITSTLAGAGTVTAQFAIVKVSGTTTTKVVTGPSYSKTYVVDNASSFAVTFKASGQTGVSIAAAEKVTVVFNGTDYIKLAGTIANAAGSNTQIQFNNGGLFGASANLTWDGTTLSSTQVNITGQGTLRLQDTTGGEYVGLRSPGTLGASYTLTFPADDGTSGQALITDGSGVLSWSTAASGDVYGPASSTDNAVARFDSTTGKLLQNSVVLIGDTGAVTGVTDLTASGSVTLSGGTANGVAYLNGSKVVTSGSALVFDGTTLGVPRLAQSGSGTYGSFNSSGAGNAWASYQYAGTEIGEIGQGSGIISGGSNTDFGIRATNNLVFGISFNEQMRLTSTGLGIGTSSPVSKLQVVDGDITVTTSGSFSGFNSTRATIPSSVGIQLGKLNFSAYSTGTTYVQGASIQAFSSAAWSSTSAPSYLSFQTTASGSTSLTERMVIDSSGNLGLGVTPSAWGSIFKVLQIGAGASYLGGRTDSVAGRQIWLGTNSYYDGTNWLYSVSQPAAQYYQNDGAHIWNRAASGTAGNAITFTQAMTLTAEGNLGIGSTSPTNLSNYKTITMNATTGSIIDLQSAGTTLGRIQTDTTYALALWTATATPMVFGTNYTERMRLDSSGNLGLGVTPSAWASSKAIQIGSTYSLALSAFGDDSSITTNAYYNNAGNWVYQNTASTYKAARYNQYLGNHIWSVASATGTAGSTITWSESARINTSGNFGIGTSSPLAKLDSRGTAIITTNANGDNILAFGNTSVFGGALSGAPGSSYGNSFIVGESSTGSGAPGFLKFYTTTGGSVSERMRLDSSGNLLVGTTATNASLTQGVTAVIGSGASKIHIGHVTGTVDGSTYAVFSYNGTAIGTITQSLTNAVLYNTTSDYRLKTVVGAVTGQGARIDALKPIDYQWKEGGQQARGFLAHEFQAVYPNSVTGEKDAVDADGNPVHQVMQASTAEVIADLVAEIQSLRKRLADAGI